MAAFCSAHSLVFLPQIHYSAGVRLAIYRTMLKMFRIPLFHFHMETTGPSAAADRRAAFLEIGSCYAEISLQL